MLPWARWSAPLARFGLAIVLLGANLLLPARSASAVDLAATSPVSPATIVYGYDAVTDILPRWPQDHAAVDPFRKPGY